MFKIALLALVAAQIVSATVIDHPSLDLSDLGGSFGLLGSYAAISSYSQTNASSFLEKSPTNSSQDSSKLFLRFTSNNTISELAQFNGTSSSMYDLGDETVLVTGSFTQVNGQEAVPPIIFNPATGNFSSLFELLINGSVSLIMVDDDLVYLGGNFTFNNTNSAAVYNKTSKSVHLLPFQGFGENSLVNSIVKILDSSEDGAGSIIFGGHFNSLGLEDLLTHNISNPVHNISNATNESLITAEQIISLKHGIFSLVSSDTTDLSGITCPKSGSVWSPVSGKGGEWKVELPDEMKGLAPTKVRIYFPTDGDDQVEQFRIYSYPNNGIMNLSYVNPETNEISYCDAWCPAWRQSDLADIVQTNAHDAQDLSFDNEIFVDATDGSYSLYYDSSTQTKTLGYGANYMEYAFENSVEIDKVGLTVTSWYGSKGLVAGFELYLNVILVYGNETLNEANCGTGTDDSDNISQLSGTWHSIHDLTSLVSGNNYLVAQNATKDTSVTFYPNILYSGSYSLLLNTPGCIADGSCSVRSIVNVTVYDVDDQVLSNHEIYQNNNYDKFDYLYYGHMNGTSTSNGRNKVVVSYSRAVDESVLDPWVVIDKITTNIVSLDEYYGINATNITTAVQTFNITHLDLNGLFEYSLANFSDFDESRVHNVTSNNSRIILESNTYVGNSSINFLSSKLDSAANVTNIIHSDSDLIISGDFNVNLTTFSSNSITLQLDQYNSTSNETEFSTAITKRSQLQNTHLFKRDSLGSSSFFNATFDSSITYMSQTAFGLFVLGDFTMSANSLSIRNLANKNSTTSTAHNFGLYISGEWYGFGNSRYDSSFAHFTNITLNGVEYFVFSGDNNVIIWDNTNQEFISGDNGSSLNISNAVSLSDRQIVLGDGFVVPDNLSRDQSMVLANNTIGKYDFNVTKTNTSLSNIDLAFYVNSTMSVLSGNFNTSLGVKNLGLMNSETGELTSLNGDWEWASNGTIQSIYAGSDVDYLFLGHNGTVSVNLASHLPGIVIYDLQNNSLASFQPATLVPNTGSSLQVNGIAVHDADSRLIVGGAFASAGSLECPSVCIYDIVNTRWIQPSSNSSISGTVSDLKFITSDIVLLAGNLTIGETQTLFATYDFSLSSFAVVNLELSKLTPGVNKFIKMDKNEKVGGRYIAYGSDFVSGFNGTGWLSIDDLIDKNQDYSFNDAKILVLASSNSNNDEQFFDNDQVLLLAGSFLLKSYGLVNSAIYNGSEWIPYAYTTDDSATSLGSIKSILVKDLYGFKSSEVFKIAKKLSRGKVVGISLACAIGATAVLSLLYLVPYFLLFRSSKDDGHNQRIQEDEMMEAVDPHDLIHEIDAQKK